MQVMKVATIHEIYYLFRLVSLRLHRHRRIASIFFQLLESFPLNSSRFWWRNIRFKVGKETCCVEPAVQTGSIDFSVISRVKVTHEAFQLNFEEDDIVYNKLLTP